MYFCYILHTVTSECYDNLLTIIPFYRDIKSDSSGISISKAYQGDTWFILHQGFYPILLVLVVSTIGAVIWYCRYLKKYSRVSTYHNDHDHELQDSLVSNKQQASSQHYQQPYDVRIEMWNITSHIFLFFETINSFRNF